MQILLLWKSMHDVILCLIQQSLLPCMEVHDVIFMSDTTSFTTMEVHDIIFMSDIQQGLLPWKSMSLPSASMAPLCLIRTALPEDSEYSFTWQSFSNFHFSYSHQEERRHISDNTKTPEVFSKFISDQCQCQSVHIGSLWVLHL